MPDGTTIPLLDHDLSDDEFAWMRDVYRDFDAIRVARGAAPGFNPKDALREVLSQEKYWLGPAAPDLSGPGAWRLGRNRHDRGVAAVFLPRVELHRHEFSRTDQFAMYVMGEADAFSMENGQPMLTPVTGGAHFHNPPDAPHAFVPKVGQAVPENWEIAFIAITPRNLAEDTHSVPERIKAAYERAVGRPAPVHV